MDLVRHFDETALSQALEDWAWHQAVRESTPLFATLFGDIFLRHPSGAHLFLDVAAGTPAKVAADDASFREALDLVAVQERCFQPTLAEQAAALGLVLADGQIFDFIVPPVLGGAREASNLQAADFAVSVSILGQIHRQVAGVPEGTPVTAVSVEGAPAATWKWFGSR